MSSREKNLIWFKIFTYYSISIKSNTMKGYYDIARQNKRSDGLYKAKVSVGRDKTGKLICVSVYAKTQRELEVKKEELKQQYKQSLNIKGSNTLMKDYAKMWLPTSKSKKSHNTIAMYENAIEKHIIPCIGHFRLADIRKSDIQNLINEIYEMPETCVKVSMTLKQILSAALDDRLITENPYRNIELPKRPPSKKRALTDLEKQAHNRPDSSYFSAQLCYYALLLRNYYKKGCCLAWTQ